jgi:hypothetical protein
MFLKKAVMTVKTEPYSPFTTREISPSRKISWWEESKIRHTLSF